MTRKAKAQIALTYLDSRNPGTVKLTIPGITPLHIMTIAEAADLSERLAQAVRASGYEFIARPRKDR